MFDNDGSLTGEEWRTLSGMVLRKFWWLFAGAGVVVGALIWAL